MKKIILSGVLLLLLLGFIGCTETTTAPDFSSTYPDNRVFYEIFVRSFADSDQDGIGDFNGITAKLDYLSSLGVETLWLMPIHPASSYHGYDVTDYYDVNSDYGTMADFENLVATAANYGIEIMIDFVINHTSSQHPWFQAALEGDSTYKNYYNFVPASTNTLGLLGSWYQTIWHTAGNEKYVGYFNSSMPDLNMTNTDVNQMILDVAKFWIDKGVKGFRVDAAQHLFGKNEYLSMTYTYQANISFLQVLTQQIKDYDEDVFIIGEIYEESDFRMLSEYYDAFDAPIDFPSASRISKSFTKESNAAYVAVLNNVYKAYAEINPDFIAMPFITNHDMDRPASFNGVTDEELRLAAEMLLTLPGNPILYYGEELGMKGVKAQGPTIWDETRRLEFLWGDDYQCDWVDSLSATLAQLRLDNAEIATAYEQQADANSLFSHYQNLIQLRNANMALKYGNSFSPYEDNTEHIQGFYRSFTSGEWSQNVLVIHNFGSADYDISDIDGTILYLSNNDDFDDITLLPSKSTVIFEVNEGE